MQREICTLQDCVGCMQTCADLCSCVQKEAYTTPSKPVTTHQTCLLYSSQLYHDPSHILFFVNSPYPCRHCSQVPDAWFRPAEVVGNPRLFMMPTRELFNVRSSTKLSVNCANVTSPPGKVLGLEEVLLRESAPQLSGPLPRLGQAASLSCASSSTQLAKVNSRTLWQQNKTW